jgi:DNA-binding CsgD family transcriptional regulator
MLAAARAKHDAGALDESTRLLNAVETGPLDEREGAEAQHLRGQTAFDQRHGTEAVRLPVGAARRLEVIDADQLQAAHQMLEAMGIKAFAERARRELLATGETARKRTVQTRDELTAQETQIARFAREGLSNPEIGARLFIGPRTVKYHLRKVFTKLDLSSRNELSRAQPSDATASGAF